MRRPPTDRDKRGVGDRIRVVKGRGGPHRPAERDPAVVATVSEMLSRIEREGMPAVLDYAARLDGFTGSELRVPDAELARAGDQVPAPVRAALDTGAERTKRFAAMQRARLQDFEDEVVPGVVCGQRLVPVQNVGAYLPAGRVPALASPFQVGR